MQGVIDAFTQWNDANAISPILSDVQARGNVFSPFEPPSPEVEPRPTGDIQIYNEFLPPDPQTGAIRYATANGPFFASTGYIDVQQIKAELVFTTDFTKLSSKEGFLKFALHEIGHLLGLFEGYKYVNGVFYAASAGSTVMNGANGRDDAAGFLPKNVTPCDQLAAALYARRPLP